MGIVIRGVRNVLRNPLRLILVVLLLGASLMFVAAMVSLNNSAQDQLQTVRSEVGTGITISYASENRGATQGNNNQTGNGNKGNGNGGNGGNGGFFGGNQNRTPIPSATTDKVKAVSGVVSIEENLRRIDTTGVLKTSTIQGPDGNSRTLPLIVNGVSKGATHFTLSGATPTITSGRGFENSDDNSNVALISKTLADTNNLKVNSTFTLQNTKITIIGLYTSEQFADSSVTLPLTAMQRIYKVDGVDSITAYAKSYDDVSALATKLRTALGTEYDVISQNGFFSNTSNALNVAGNSIRLALIISLIVACVVVIFSVIVLVRERTSEIGTLKAIGASHWQVIGQFWIEVLALSVLGSVVAILLLAVLGPVVSSNFDVASATNNFGGFTRGNRGGGFGGNGGGGGFVFQGGGNGRFGDLHLAAATLNLQTLLIILGLGIALAVMTSAIPAWYVSRIKPAEVLRKGA